MQERNEKVHTVGGQRGDRTSAAHVPHLTQTIARAAQQQRMAKPYATHAFRVLLPTANTQATIYARRWRVGDIPQSKCATAARAGRHQRAGACDAAHLNRSELHKGISRFRTSEPS